MSYENLVHISWDHIMQNVQDLSARIAKDHPDLEELICVARGGMAIGCLLSYALPLRKVKIISSVRYTKKDKTIDHEFSLPDNIKAAHKALLVDDLVDQGVTMHNIKQKLLEQNPALNVITCTLSIKDSPDKHPIYYPDYYADTYDYSQWLLYPWGVIEKEEAYIKGTTP